MKPTDFNNRAISRIRIIGKSKLFRSQISTSFFEHTSHRSSCIALISSYPLSKKNGNNLAALNHVPTDPSPSEINTSHSFRRVSLVNVTSLRPLQNASSQTLLDMNGVWFVLVFSLQRVLFFVSLPVPSFPLVPFLVIELGLRVVFFRDSLGHDACSRLGR